MVPYDLPYVRMFHNIWISIKSHFVCSTESLNCVHCRFNSSYIMNYYYESMRSQFTTADSVGLFWTFVYYQFRWHSILDGAHMIFHFCRVKRFSWIIKNFFQKNICPLTYIIHHLCVESGKLAQSDVTLVLFCF